MKLFMVFQNFSRKYVRNGSKMGFTLIELLVVISVISLLSSVVFSSVNSARVKARDVRRKADLHALQLAVELYYSNHGTYTIANSGYSNGGTGFLDCESAGASYTTAISRALYNDGLLSQPIISDPVSPVCAGYMYYSDGTRYALYATLENAASGNAAYAQNYISGAYAVGTLGKNYGVGNF